MLAPPPRKLPQTGRIADSFSPSWPVDDVVATEIGSGERLRSDMIETSTGTLCAPSSGRETSTLVQLNYEME